MPLFKLSNTIRSNGQSIFSFRRSQPIQWIVTIVLISLSVAEVFGAQKVIEGMIRDRETGQALPAANIQIEGTLSGTISNEQGVYILKLEKLPATILVSYIGYASERVTVTEESSRRQDIFLTPISYQLEPIIVTDEDPAVRIMREVIRRKKEWRANLQSYQANAYTRVVLENDTSITSIMESISIAFWRKDKGTARLSHLAGRLLISAPTKICQCRSDHQLI